MKLSECKSLIRGYRKCAEEGNVDFNWLTTARWSLRHSWAAEERDAALARAERAEAEVERLKSELNALSNYIMDDEIISVLALAPSDNDLLSPDHQEGA